MLKYGNCNPNAYSGPVDITQICSFAHCVVLLWLEVYHQYRFFSTHFPFLYLHCFVAPLPGKVQSVLLIFFCFIWRSLHFALIYYPIEVLK